LTGQKYIIIIIEKIEKRRIKFDSENTEEDKARKEIKDVLMTTDKHSGVIKNGTKCNLGTISYKS
jgi:hypothetical protein